MFHSVGIAHILCFCNDLQISWKYDKEWRRSRYLGTVTSEWICRTHH